jgi:hypothetical protein
MKTAVMETIKQRVRSRFNDLAAGARGAAINERALRTSVVT